MASGIPAHEDMDFSTYVPQKGLDKKVEVPLVPSRLEGLSLELDHLEKALGVLWGRLEPVLSSLEETDVVDGPVPAPSGGAVARGLHSCIERVRRCTRDLRSLTERLEV